MNRVGGDNIRDNSNPFDPFGRGGYPLSQYPLTPNLVPFNPFGSGR